MHCTQLIQAPRILRALVAGVILLQFVGILLGPVLTSGQERIPQFCRLPSSGLLVLIAAIICISASGPRRRTAALIFSGMAFGHLGDLAMSRVIPTQDPWLAGMILFGGGHLLYAAAFWRTGRALPHPSDMAVECRAVCEVPPQPLPWRSSVALFTVASLIAIAAMLPGTEAPMLLRLGGLAYAVIISVMTGLALALARADARLTPLAVGALLFWLSDLMLGASLFASVGGSLWNDAIWVAYIAGQGLIVMRAGVSRK